MRVIGETVCLGLGGQGGENVICARQEGFYEWGVDVVEILKLVKVVLKICQLLFPRPSLSCSPH